MAKKINSERQIDNDLFKIKIGTINKKNPKVVYIDCGFFIEPKIEKEDYSDDINSLEEEIRKLSKKLTNAIMPQTDGKNLFKKDFIFVFEVAESRVSYGKKSYVSFQLHLKQNEEVLKFSEITKYIETLSKILTNEILNQFEDVFIINKTKKP